MTTMLGFNFGIEAAQLLVVALAMPSLIILNSTTAYPALRTTTAMVGATLATGWLAQRTGVLTTNPLEPAADVLVDHPFVVAAGLAALALVAAAASLRAGHLPATVADEALTDEAGSPSPARAETPTGPAQWVLETEAIGADLILPCRFHSSAARQRPSSLDRRRVDGARVSNLDAETGPLRSPEVAPRPATRAHRHDGGQRLLGDFTQDRCLARLGPGARRDALIAAAHPAAGCGSHLVCGLAGHRDEAWLKRGLPSS